MDMFLLHPLFCLHVFDQRPHNLLSISKFWESVVREVKGRPGRGSLSLGRWEGERLGEIQSPRWHGEVLGSVDFRVQE
jgi:hypothetical protein